MKISKLSLNKHYHLIFIEYTLLFHSLDTCNFSQNLRESVSNLVGKEKKKKNFIPKTIFL